MGTGRTKKRRLSAERHWKSITRQRGQDLHRKVADVVLVHHPKNEVRETHQGKSEMQATRLANGTETQTDWNAVNWQKTNRLVRHLRQRIFRATQEGNLKKVRALQKLMLKSHSNRLVSVRRVTPISTGRKTPGIDKLVIKTPAARGRMVDHLAHSALWKAKPVRRVYRPKAKGKLRPLGIPAIIDRCLQAMVKNALEPAWEAKFESSRYGFRPGRNCHDAIAKIYGLARPNTRKKWV